MTEPQDVYLLNNGMVIAFDKAGKQVPKYQGKIDEIRLLLQKDFPNLKIKESLRR